MKVYIQKPWKTSDSPYYKFLKEFPPAGVKYFNLTASNLIQSKKKMVSLHKSKALIKRMIKLLYPSMPNLHYTKNAKKYDLIHCAHCMSANNHPWICNMEYVGQFWAAPKKYGLYGEKSVIKKYLKSENCKKIVAWTDWVRDDIVREFPEIAHKTEVIYPGIPSQKKIDRSRRKNIRLLFSCRRFYFKGGLYAVEVMDRLTKKYDNVEAVVVSDVPKEILSKYSGNKKIKFMDMMPQEKLFGEIYPSADIFIFPSFTDTFGFQITEAMSFGVPVVSVEGQSRRELIEDGKTGFVTKTVFKGSIGPECLERLEEKTLNDLVEKTDRLICDKKLRSEMSKECVKLFKSGGKFSIETRNRKLKKVYFEAIGN